MSPNLDSRDDITILGLMPDDWRIWRELRLRALAESPHAFGSTLAEWTGTGDLESRWRARLTNVPFNAVALLNDTLAGMIGASKPDEDSCSELLSMFVAPEARGRGVGDVLILAVCNWAAAQDAAVLLRVYDDNLPAIRFYERNGFAKTGLVEPSPDGRRELVLLRPR